MSDRAGIEIAADRGYPLWASQYDAENAVTTLEVAAADQLTPSLRGRRLLDAGCGTGRRLPPTRAGLVRTIGLDRVVEMLRSGPHTGATRVQTINAGVADIPLASASFDVAWCRLVLGHVEDLRPAYRELHRVLDDGGCLIVTDFHPDAVAAGHRRTFTDPSDQTRALRSFAHSVHTHVETARDAGFDVELCRDWCVGKAVRAFYEAADRLARYQADVGLPLVLGLRFRRSISR